MASEVAWFVPAMGSDGKKNDEDFLIGTRWSPEIMTFCRQAIIIFRDNLSWLVLVLSLLMNLAGSSRKLHHRARVCMQSWIKKKQFSTANNVLKR